MKKPIFALIGAAGYIAPRHLKAMRDVGGTLTAALDPNDSVGILDAYYPEADFFVEFERFDRHLEKLRRNDPDRAARYVSICSPNYLHDAHIRFALRVGADAICEKPVVLNPWNIDILRQIEEETGRKIHTILQLRLHPAIIDLRDLVRASPQDKMFDIELTYVASRGKWYHHSWKGDVKKSGGIATNIGIHFFDMLGFMFGNVERNVVHYRDESKAAGLLEFKQARVRWFLSVDFADIPRAARERGQPTYRSIMMNGQEIEFSDGFTELHTRAYEGILQGDGFGIEENRIAVETVAEIRIQHPKGKVGDYHPYLCEISK